YLRSRELSRPSPAIHGSELDSRGLHAAAPDERIVGLLRGLGAVLRAAHAGAGFLEDRRAPLRHAEGPPVARAPHHHRREDADRPADLRRGGRSDGARITIPASTGRGDLNWYSQSPSVPMGYALGWS